MGVRPRLICRGSGSSFKPPSGPVCIPSEPQTSLLCNTVPPQGGGGHGHNVTGLEQLGQDLPLSPGEHSAAGPEQAQGLQGESDPHCPPLAQQPMVPSPAGAQSIQAQLFEPQAVSACQRADLIRFICSDPAPSYVAFLARIFGSHFFHENIHLLTGGIHHYTQNQYQSVWASWVAYVR